jgi:hypothetical protein
MTLFHDSSFTGRPRTFLERADWHFGKDLTTLSVASDEFIGGGREKAE